MATSMPRLLIILSVVVASAWPLQVGAVAQPGSDITAAPQSVSVGEPVEVTFTGLDTEPCRIVSSADGASAEFDFCGAEQSLTVTPAVPGTLTLALQTNDDGEWFPLDDTTVEVAPAPVDPFIEVDPASPRPASTVTITYNALAPACVIQIFELERSITSLDCSDAQEQTTDFRVPDEPGQTLTLALFTMRDGEFQAVARDQITVVDEPAPDATIELDPVAGLPGERVQVVGQNFRDADGSLAAGPDIRCTVTVGGVAAEDVVCVFADGDLEGLLVVPELAVGVHLVTVRTEGSAAEAPFEVQAAPTLLVQDDAVAAREDTQLSIEPLGNDRGFDLDAAPLRVVRSPALGTAEARPDGTIDYTPRPHANGSDSFDYRVCALENCGQATVTIAIEPVPDPPAAADNEAHTPAGEAVDTDVLSDDQDPDGDLEPSTLRVMEDPTNGTATITAAGVITYSPAEGFDGRDRLVYEVCDSTGRCDDANLAVVVMPAECSAEGNPAPTIELQPESGRPGTEGDIVVQWQQLDPACVLATSGQLRVDGTALGPPIDFSDGNEDIRTWRVPDTVGASQHVIDLVVTDTPDRVLTSESFAVEALTGDDSAFLPAAAAMLTVVAASTALALRRGPRWVAHHVALVPRPAVKGRVSASRSPGSTTIAIRLHPLIDSGTQVLEKEIRR